MKQVRVNHTMMLYIHNNIMLDLNSVANEFIQGSKHQ